MSTSSRKRAKNYTSDEEMLLAELVEEHQSIIENKKSDANMWKRKKEAWQKIGGEFSTTLGSHRHWKALREKYDALKRRSKQEVAKKKRDGESSANISNVSAKIASMLGLDGDACNYIHT